MIAVGLTGCGVSSLDEMGVGTPVGLADSTSAAAIGTGADGATPANATPANAPAGTAKFKTTGASADEPAVLKSNDARRAAETIAKASDASSGAYLIGPQDQLKISVFKVPELSKTLEVSNAGTINFPLLGDVKVAGRTTRAVERDIKAQLDKRYLQNAQLTVSVSEFNSQRVTMDGAFKKPGVYPLRGNMTLLQAVANAKGLVEEANETILVFRDVDGKRAAAKFDVASIRSGDIEDPQIQSGDVVVASTSTTHRAFKSLSKVLPIASFLLLL